jgi:hypothetical protein
MLGVTLIELKLQLIQFFDFAYELFYFTLEQRKEETMVTPLLAMQAEGRATEINPCPNFHPRLLQSMLAKEYLSTSDTMWAVGYS